MRVLVSWDCNGCTASYFAEVAFAHGRVESIRETELDPATLDRIHYREEGVDEMLERIIGERFWTEEGLRPDWLEALRSALEAGRRWG